VVAKKDEGTLPLFIKAVKERPLLHYYYPRALLISYRKQENKMIRCVRSRSLAAGVVSASGQFIQLTLLEASLSPQFGGIPEIP